MRTFTRPGSYLMFPALLMSAGAVQAQNDPCEAIPYRQVVLRDSAESKSDCVQVFISDGDRYAALPANVIRIQNDHVLLRVWPPGGIRWEIRSIAMSPPFRVLIEGQPPALQPVPIWEADDHPPWADVSLRPRAEFKPPSRDLAPRHPKRGFLFSSAMLVLISATAARIRWLPTLK